MRCLLGSCYLAKKNGLNNKVMDQLQLNQMLEAVEKSLVQGEALPDPLIIENAVLEGADFSGRTLRNLVLQNVRFPGANCSGTRFENARLTDVDLSGADLTGAMFLNSSLERVDLSNARLVGADLGASTIEGGSLKHCIADGIRIVRTALRNVDIAGSSFVNGDVVKSEWTGCRVDAANFQSTNAVRARFDGCSMVASSWNGAMLAGAEFSGCELSGSAFSGADLRGVAITNSDVTDVTGPVLSTAALRVAGLRIAAKPMLEPAVVGNSRTILEQMLDSPVLGWLEHDTDVLTAYHAAIFMLGADAATLSGSEVMSRVAGSAADVREGEDDWWALQWAGLHAVARLGSLDGVRLLAILVREEEFLERYVVPLMELLDAETCSIADDPRREMYEVFGTICTILASPFACFVAEPEQMDTRALGSLMRRAITGRMEDVLSAKVGMVYLSSTDARERSMIADDALRDRMTLPNGHIVFRHTGAMRM